MRPEQIQVDAVSEHRYPLAGNAEPDNGVFKSLAYRDDPCSFACRLLNHAAGPRKLWDEVHIGSPCGDYDRFFQAPAQPDCRHTIRKEVMGIDEIEIPLLLETHQHRKGSGRERSWRRAHPKFGQYEVFRVLDCQLSADFSRHDFCVISISTENGCRKGKPGNRSDNTGVDLAVRNQMPQSVLDEHTVMRLDRIGVERREGKDFHPVAATMFARESQRPGQRLTRD